MTCLQYIRENNVLKILKWECISNLYGSSFLFFSEIWTYNYDRKWNYFIYLSLVFFSIFKTRARCKSGSNLGFSLWWLLKICHKLSTRFREAWVFINYLHLSIYFIIWKKLKCYINWLQGRDGKIHVCSFLVAKDLIRDF